MRAAGKLLIYGAVLLRAVVVLSGAPWFQTVFPLLAAYGLLLIAQTWLVHRNPAQLADFPGSQIVYLLLQSTFILGMLVVSHYEDFLAELFIPLSLDAVGFFGRQNGFRIIAVFSAIMVGLFLFSPEGPLFGLAMGLLYSGLCFLFGGYAGQVQKAETARLQNQQTFTELQTAHRELRGYADRLVSLAVERERGHLARDLHDSVTQTVFSMNLTAQSARLLWDMEPDRVPVQLDHLEDLAVSAQREIQSLVSQLRPPPITESSLPAALQKLALEQKSKNGLQVAMEISGADSYPATISTALFFIAHEALMNVAKHSGVCEAVVRLHLEKDRSCLEIEDQGIGFDLPASSDVRGHLGLTGMLERADEIGWGMAVESKRGKGTIIRVREGASGGHK